MKNIVFSNNIKNLPLVFNYNIRCGFEDKTTPSPAGCFYPKQVHGKKILHASYDTGEGDGIYTKTAQQTVAIQTADCLPLLIIDTKKTIAMAVHVGWKGLVSNVVGAAMQTYNVKHAFDDMIMIIGPCIHKESFIVNTNVIDQITEANINICDFQITASTHRINHDTWMLNLVSLVCFQAMNYGVSPRMINVLDSCTYVDHHRWYSYRKGDKTYRNWSWITLE